ncbi:MAG: hypothetical protein ABIC82_06205 [bacterium]
MEVISQKEKEMEDELFYEIDMFKKTCDRFSCWNELCQFRKNLLIESLATHTRVLIDFFYCDNKKFPDDDIIAQDLLPDNIVWKEIRPQELPQILKDAKVKADKQLAHLTLSRLRLERENKKGWDYKQINQEMNKIIECFNNVKNTTDRI